MRRARVSFFSADAQCIIEPLTFKMQMNLESQNKEIVAEVKQAIASGSLGEWVAPWISKGMPTNLSTGRIYSGMWNQRILHKAFSQRIFRAHSWATFSQIRKIGGRVLKGEHGVAIIMPKVITEKSPDETDENRQMYFRSVAVFNIEQTNLKLSDYFVDPKAAQGLKSGRGIPVDKGHQSIA
jgi:antirestriction protein ArdC